MPSARTAKGEASGKAPPKKPDAAAIEEALRRVEERLKAMEARLSSLEERVVPVVKTDAGPPCCSDDIIGCLDDCNVDVKELRKKVKDARSPARRH